MGSGRIDYFPSNREGEVSPSLSYHEIAENLCPDYLAMGMTYDEYWNGEPDAVIFYRKAYDLKREHKNNELWLQGRYIYEALGDISPLFHDLIKDPKAMPYLAEPFPITKETKDKREQRDAEEQDKKVQASVKAWAERVNRLKAKKGAQNG